MMMMMMALTTQINELLHSSLAACVNIPRSVLSINNAYVAALNYTCTCQRQL